MIEKRRLKRRHLIYYLRIFRKDTNEQIAHLVNINKGGIMAVSEKPFEEGDVLECRMELPFEVSKTKEVDFEIECRWCKEDVNPDFYVTGFKFEGIEEESLAIIEEMGEAMLFED